MAIAVQETLKCDPHGGQLLPCAAIRQWLDVANNAAERALRGVANGGANWAFAGADAGGYFSSVDFAERRCALRSA